MEKRLAKLCGRDPETFSPRTSADDCEALIRKLNELGYWVIINIHKDGTARIMIGKGISDSDWQKYEADFDNYKHGVCDLAEKIIEQQEDGDA